jgi:transcriptional regulator with XRE-family HTH domain
MLGMSLSAYLKQHALTYEKFGEMIGVTGTTVYRYIRGDRFPKPAIIRKAEKVTNGEISFNSFPPKKSSKPKRNGKAHD